MLGRKMARQKLHQWISGGKAGHKTDNFRRADRPKVGGGQDRRIISRDGGTGATSSGPAGRKRTVGGGR